jgi:diacylglycerol kinase family enzyme
MNYYRRMPMVSGSMAYNLAIVQAFMGKIGNQIQVTVDGAVVAEGRYLLSAVANGRCYGGGYFASPNSMVDDGTLDVVMVKVPKTLLQIPGLLAVYKTGAHLTDDKYASLVEVYHGKKVCIKSTKALNFTADGECDQAVKREFEIMHHAIRFLVPKGCKTDCLIGAKEEVTV